MKAIILFTLIFLVSCGDDSVQTKNNLSGKTFVHEYSVGNMVSYSFIDNINYEKMSFENSGYTLSKGTYTREGVRINLVHWDDGCMVSNNETLEWGQGYFTKSGEIYIESLPYGYASNEEFRAMYNINNHIMTCDN